MRLHECGAQPCVIYVVAVSVLSYDFASLPAALPGALRAEHQSGVRAHREEADGATRQVLAALRARLHLDGSLGVGLPREGGDGAHVGVALAVVASHGGAVADPRGETLGTTR